MCVFFIIERYLNITRILWYCNNNKHRAYRLAIKNSCRWPHLEGKSEEEEEDILYIYMYVFYIQFYVLIKLVMYTSFHRIKRALINSCHKWSVNLEMYKSLQQNQWLYKRTYSTVAVLLSVQSRSRETVELWEDMFWYSFLTK